MRLRWRWRFAAMAGALVVDGFLYEPGTVRGVVVTVLCLLVLAMAIWADADGTQRWR